MTFKVRLSGDRSWRAITGDKFKNDAHLIELLTALDYIPLAVTLVAYAAQAEPDLYGIWQRWREARTRLLRSSEGQGRLLNTEICYEICISRLVDFYVNFAISEGPKVAGADRLRVCRRIALQWANIECALLQGLQSKSPESAIRGTLALVEFICSTGTGSAKVLENAASAAQRSGNAQAEADCIKGLSDIALELGHYEEARTRLKLAQMLYSKTGNLVGEANCVNGLGDVATRWGDNYIAEACYEQALVLYRQANNVLGQAISLEKIGDLKHSHSNDADAQARYEQAIVLYQSISEVYSLGVVHRQLARIASDPIKKKFHLTEAATAWQEIEREDLIAELKSEFGKAFIG